jgi:hypothetical protein
VVTVGVLTGGVVTVGVLTGGVVTGGTVTCGTVTDGTVTDGAVTDGTVTVGNGDWAPAGIPLIPTATPTSVAPNHKRRAGICTPRLCPWKVQFPVRYRD